MDVKFCPNCMLTLPLTTEFFYPNRRKDRLKPSWQSYCIECWPIINHKNKQRRRGNDD